MKNQDTHFNNPRSLSADERESMRREFAAFMDANPALPRKPARQVASPYFPHLVGAPAFFALALLIVGGTAYAAEESVPNELLYPLKTTVIEPVFIEGLAFTDRAKAEASRTLVTRRLAEAEELIRKDALDADAASLIEASIEEHAGAVQDYVEEASRNGELSEALEAGTDLENTFEAYGDVLETMVEADPSTEEAYGLIDDVNERANLIENLGDAIEERVSLATDEEIDEYIANAVEEIVTVTAEVREKGTPAEVGDELAGDVAAFVTASEESYATGRGYLSESKKREALPFIRDALQSVEQASILLDSDEERRD